MTKLIGLFGGTFDPVHYGHLRPALDVLQAADLAEVRFIPNRVPPHRDAPLLGDAQHPETVQLAIADPEGFLPAHREVRREGQTHIRDN